MQSMIGNLVFKGNISGTMYVADYDRNRVIHKMDHLACFVGGVWCALPFLVNYWLLQ